MPSTAFPAFASVRRLPNLFDIAAGICIFGALIYVAGIARGTMAPLDTPEATAITLDPSNLPGYAVRTTLRMFAALLCSLLFTFTYATWAAKSRRAGLILVPVLDILQSVPILGFLTFTVVFFMSLFPGRVLGAELAAIFAIFTSQAWNMAFSLYQSLKTVPADLDEAARSLQPQRVAAVLAAGGALRHAGPGLEHHDEHVGRLVLRGRQRGDQRGRYHLETARHRQLRGAGAWSSADIPAVFYAILDHAGRHPGLRPVAVPAAGRLVQSKFRFELTAVRSEVEDPWMLKLLRRTRLLRAASGDWRSWRSTPSAACGWRSKRPGAAGDGAPGGIAGHRRCCSSVVLGDRARRGACGGS